MNVIRRLSKYMCVLFLSLPMTFLADARAISTDNGLKVEKTMVSEQDIDRVLKDHSAELLAIPGVEGAARGECAGKPCLKIYISQESSELRKQLEAIIGGLPFEIEKSGSFQAM